MTATVHFEPDVEAFLQKAMEERHAPLDRVLNEILRASFPRQARGADVPYTQPTYEMGLPTVDFGPSIAAFLDDIEDRERVAKMSRYHEGP